MKMKPTSRAQKTTISKEDWEVFANAIEGISERAAVDIKLGIAGGELRRRLGREPGPFETWDEETMNAAIGLVHDVIEYDGAASAEIAMAMYDELSALEKKIIKPAEPADIPGTGEVAKMMYGVKKSSGDVDEVARAGKRMVKTVSQDTLLKNAARDGAQFAWIPNGAETCFFCIMLASRGWQNISKVSLRKGHAEHIHNNCKCCYMIRHSDNIEVEGYDPGDYEELYYKYYLDPNRFRREQYDEIKDERNAKRREKYAEKKKVVPNYDVKNAPFKNYSKEEIIEMAKETEEILSKHLDIPSKWSGKLLFTEEEIWRKEWNCDILTSYKTEPIALLHEQIHARSISLLGETGLDIYQRYKMAEEASVQLLAEEICKKEGIIFEESLYSRSAETIRKINQAFRLFSSDYEMAVGLIKIPPQSRLDWLIDMTRDRISFEEYQDLLKMWNDVIKVK